MSRLSFDQGLEFLILYHGNQGKIYDTPQENENNLRNTGSYFLLNIFFYKKQCFGGGCFWGGWGYFLGVLEGYWEVNIMGKL